MKSDVLRLFRTAVAAVDPYLCVKEHLVFTTTTSQQSTHVTDGSIDLSIDNQHLKVNRNLYVAAFGKAALGIRIFKRFCSFLLRTYVLCMCY
jgi:glycerate-2-kinase